MISQTNLSHLIAPVYYPLHRSITKKEFTHYWVKGGRGSCKSSFVSLQIVYGMMKEPLQNTVVLRKVGLNLKESVYEQLIWAIEALGVSHLWECRYSPLALIYLPTGQRIIFRGGDDPKKIKSTKLSKGYFAYVWYEEVDEFLGLKEIRSINQSLLRGGNDFSVFYSFNPPRQKHHWINKVTEKNHRKDTTVFHCTYLDIPPSWLGGQFFLEAGYLKEDNLPLYDHEYLGIPSQSGGEVFNNLTLREISPEEKDGFPKFLRGIDWGFAADPFVYLVAGYCQKKKTLWVYHEFYQTGAKFHNIIRHIQEENLQHQVIIADSAEPRSNSVLKEEGIPVIPAKKGAGSVEFGITFLQNLSHIIIDPSTCPNTAREFSSYQLEKDKFGNYLGSFPDKDNHTIDALRYGLNLEMKPSSFSFS